ncbi:MAG: carboxypeptidase-like regulatory domain-containing protein [Bacteroidota bacterium]
MVKKITVILLSVFIPFHICYAQPRQLSLHLELSGKIINAGDQQPLPYANIYNYSSKKGTISNENGDFTIAIQSLNDTIVISYTGFITRQLSALEIRKQKIVALSFATTLLDEVTVLADNSFLYEMIASCKKKPHIKPDTAKTYFSLNTFIGNKEVEMLEAYYNGIFSGYDVNDILLKNGRLAFVKYDNTSFLSTETSKAVFMLKLFEKNKYLPRQPFEMTKKEMKKHYRLSLNKKYKNESNNPVYVIGFTPNDTSGKYFSGMTWIDSISKNIIKINLSLRNSSVHPFLPLWPSDSIGKVNMDITETFTIKNDKAYFEHIDFNYSMEYMNREKKPYTIKTNAVLFAYDYESHFILPGLTDSRNYLSDYRKIEAAPYNSFFWKYNNEPSLPEQKTKNELFFSQPETIYNSKDIKYFTHDPYHRNFFEAPYIHWNGDRICFIYQPKDSISNIAKKEEFVNAPATLYELKVHLYLDVNYYKDSLHVFTATVFDPYESFYKYPIDTLANCFLNIYFDLMEIQRRELDSEIKKPGITQQQVVLLYHERKKKMESLSKTFFRECERGKNRKELLKWNNYVKEKLGIDNLKTFGIHDN